MSVDRRAASGFGSAAAAYERARPSYPPAAIAAVAGSLGLDGSSVVLDLAAGTGKLTRVLTPLVGRVIAVEPVAEMRAHLCGVEALEGTAEAIPLGGESVDAVFVAQAFHWFDAPAALAEIARVLRPGGALVVVNQVERWDEEEWAEAFGALMASVRGTEERYPGRFGGWREVLAETGRFTPLERAEAPYEHVVTPDDFIVLVSSWSWIANLPDDRRAATLADVRALLGDRSRVALPYRTKLEWARRR